MEFETGFLVEQGPFPCKTGNFGLGFSGAVPHAEVV